MPLKELFSGAHATAVLMTAGPWSDRDAAKEDTLKWLDDHFGAKMKRRHVVAEISEDGYKHIHAAIEFVVRTKCFGTKFKFRDHMVETWAKDPKEERSFNCDLHIVPNTEPDMQGRTSYDHICLKYVTKPTKQKSVDEDIIGGDNANAMPDWYVKFCEIMKIEDPVKEYEAEKFRNLPIGDRMARDYKFYKKQSDFWKRQFDKYYTGEVTWKNTS